LTVLEIKEINISEVIEKWSYRKREEEDTSALHLLVTLPFSTSVEHVFSSINIIKTSLHNKMEDVNLTNNPLVHIEFDILEESTMMMPFQIWKATRVGQLTCSIYLHT
jgi:hypothetical protein